MLSNPARIVGRKQWRRINLECEQIAYRVGVLGPIQTVNERPAGLRIRFGDAIQGTLEGRYQRSPFLGGRCGPAGRRHHACAHFPNDFFPDFAAAVDVEGVGDVQREAASLQAGVMTRDTVSI
jgi:hypothetical protein